MPPTVHLHEQSIQSRKCSEVTRPNSPTVALDSIDNPQCSDISAKLVHSWRQNCHHNQVSSQAIQAYKLCLTNGVYVQRSLAAWGLKRETSSRLFDLNVDTTAWTSRLLQAFCGSCNNLEVGQIVRLQLASACKIGGSCQNDMHLLPSTCNKPWEDAASS